MPKNNYAPRVSDMWMKGESVPNNNGENYPVLVPVKLVAMDKEQILDLIDRADYHASPNAPRANRLDAVLQDKHGIRNAKQLVEELLDEEQIEIFEKYIGKKKRRVYRRAQQKSCEMPF